MSDLSFGKALYDIELSGGDLVFTSDSGFNETMKQRIKAVLLTFLGEYFLDDQENPTVGVAYFQSLFENKLPSIELADSVFRTVILGIDGISELRELEFDHDQSNRGLRVSFQAILEDGSTIEDIIDLTI